MVAINARMMAMALGIGAAVYRGRAPSEDARINWEADWHESKHAKARRDRAAQKRRKRK